MGRLIRSLVKPEGKHKRSSRGVAILEFAVVLPLLLIVLFGIVEMSLVLYDQAMITNAAREGARFGSLFRALSETPHATSAEIQTRVNSYLTDRLITFGGATAPTVTATSETAADGSPLVAVTVTYDYGFLVLPNLATTLTGPLTLSAQARMRLE